MSLPYKILVSFLLIFSFSTKDAVSENIKVVWGALDQDINLDIPGFQLDDRIDHIRWDKGGIMVAQFRKDRKSSQPNKTYEILPNGTLKIKHLKRNFNGTYNVDIYDTSGRNVLQKAFDLRILEMVSKPKISWDCSNTTLTCKVVKGTDPELKLYQNGKHLRKAHQKVIIHKWADLNSVFNCTASNKVSEQSSVVEVSCSEKGLHFYLILGSCVGGLLLVVLVALLIFYIGKRKKQNSRRKEEQLEIKAPRATTEERGPKPHQIPASPPPNPAVFQAPPLPGHRPQAPANRPLPSGHRVHHQQQRRPPSSGTQAHQQRGPPLPRPRVQPKPPQRAAENVLTPSSN